VLLWFTEPGVELLELPVEVPLAEPVAFKSCDPPRAPLRSQLAAPVLAPGVPVEPEIVLLLL